MSTENEHQPLWAECRELREEVAKSILCITKLEVELREELAKRELRLSRIEAKIWGNGDPEQSNVGRLARLERSLVEVGKRMGTMEETHRLLEIVAKRRGSVLLKVKDIVLLLLAIFSFLYGSGVLKREEKKEPASMRPPTYVPARPQAYGPAGAGVGARADGL